MKKIVFPDIVGSRTMTAVELNRIRFSVRHTVLTPELLSQKGAVQEA